MFHFQAAKNPSGPRSTTGHGYIQFQLQYCPYSSLHFPPIISCSSQLFSLLLLLFPPLSFQYPPQRSLTLPFLFLLTINKRYYFPQYTKHRVTNSHYLFETAFPFIYILYTHKHIHSEGAIAPRARVKRASREKENRRIGGTNVCLHNGRRRVKSSELFSRSYICS